MGLDVSHNCFSGAYSSFGRFRGFLASEIGIDLYDYSGFGGGKDWAEVKHNIKPLLNHSDCDGDLTVDECKQIKKGLEEILSKMKVSEDNNEFAERIQQFIEGLECAISCNEIVEFM